MANTSTGGILNHINQKYYCSSKVNSVGIQNLIRYHNPKQNQELVALIASHQSKGVHNNCSCGSKSKGTLETFSKNLWKSYTTHKLLNVHTPKQTLQDCRIFMYNLFITNSLKGNQMEINIQRYINQNITGDTQYTCDIAPSLYDLNYGVDLIIKGANSKEIIGIQVKPISYLYMDDKHPVKAINKKLNKLYPNKVLYIYYNKDKTIYNSKEVSLEIKKVLK